VGEEGNGKKWELGTYQGFAWRVSEKRKRRRKRGGAVGSGSNNNGRNQRVHHIAVCREPSSAVPTRHMLI